MNDKYQSPLSERYASKEMQYIFSPDMKFKTCRKLCIAQAEVEKELGISYPTVRAKLDGVIQRLGFEKDAAQDEEMLLREAVLKALEQGEITAEEAIRKLK